jgi:hypothetical protein
VARTIEFWDDPDFARDIQTPADHRDVEFRIGDEVLVTLDLTAAHLAELIEHNAAWIAVGRRPPPPANAPRTREHRPKPGGAEARARLRKIRHFADALGRSAEYIRPGWTPADGLKNKYLHPADAPLGRDYDAWVAEGEPPLETWRRQVS